MGSWIMKRTRIARGDTKIADHVKSEYAQIM